MQRDRGTALSTQFEAPVNQKRRKTLLTALKYGEKT